MLYACQQEDDTIPPVNHGAPTTVQFDNHTPILENSITNKITILFDKSAGQDGELEITVSSDAMDDFQTVPAVQNGKITIEISKNDTGASFEIKPQNNQIMDGNKDILFNLNSASEGFLFGINRTLNMAILDDETAVAADFLSISATVAENVDPNSYNVIIAFSTTTPGEGKLKVHMDEATLNDGFVTNPPMDANQMLEFTIPAGSDGYVFEVKPNDDQVIKGHNLIKFSILEAEGAIIIGSQVNFELIILDDELAFKAKSYESVGGSWRSKKTYVYDELGRIKEVNWESATPGASSGTYTYYYADNGLIERINHAANIDEFFYQENGKIIKSEYVQNGIITAYDEYDYDLAGNVGGKAKYNLQSGGDYVLSLVFLYLFHDDGNLYSQNTYIPVAGEDDYQLISTRTYENYLEVANPFLGIEILPNIVVQPNLPGSYKVEENGFTIEYDFTYDYNEMGLPIRRYATSNTDSEVTSYEYY